MLHTYHIWLGMSQTWMSYVADIPRLIELFHRHDWVMLHTYHIWLGMSQTWMSHVVDIPRLIELFHRHDWVMLHTYHIWLSMSHTWMSHVADIPGSLPAPFIRDLTWCMSRCTPMSRRPRCTTYINKLCHTYKPVISHMQINHVLHANERMMHVPLYTYVTHVLVHYLYK